MSNLNSRSALHPRWTYAPLRPLLAFEQCVIAIFDPNSRNSGDNYNPYATSGEGYGFGLGGFGEDTFGGTGSGGPRPLGTSIPIKLWEGPAQLQVYRQSLTVDDVAGSVNQLRSVRITASKEGVAMPIRKGLIVRVISCELNPTLLSYEVTVTSGMGSALAWKRTIEGEVDMSVVAPPITEFTTP